MCMSTSQDDDRMTIFSIEKHGISRVKGACVRAVLRRVRASRVKGACVRAVLRGVRASRVKGACVRVLPTLKRTGKRTRKGWLGLRKSSFGEHKFGKEEQKMKCGFSKPAKSRAKIRISSFVPPSQIFFGEHKFIRMMWYHSNGDDCSRCTSLMVSVPSNGRATHAQMHSGFATRSSLLRSSGAGASVRAFLGARASPLMSVSSTL